MQKDCKSIPAMTQEESMSIEDNWRGRKLREYAARGVFAEWEWDYTQLNSQCWTPRTKMGQCAPRQKITNGSLTLYS